MVPVNATKIFWGQVLLVGAVVLIFVWAATEWTAWRLAFQCELGRPRFAVLDWPLYAPPAFSGNVHRRRPYRWVGRGRRHRHRGCDVGLARPGSQKGHHLTAHGRLLCGRQVRFMYPGDERLAKSTFDWARADERLRLSVEDGLSCFDLVAPAIATLFEQSGRFRVRLADPSACRQWLP
jgi:hypothetical protein